MVKKATTTKNQAQYRKKKIFFIAFAFVALFFLCWTIYSSTRSYPLGEKLDYIGKVSGGSYYPLSVSKPYTDYYYATNLSPEEVAKGYFKEAQVTDSSKNGQDGWYELRTKEKTVTIKVQKKADLNLAITQSASKKYILTISDYEYEALKSSL